MKPISCTINPHPTDFSRLNQAENNEVFITLPYTNIMSIIACFYFVTLARNGPQNFSETRREYIPVGSAVVLPAVDGPRKTLRTLLGRPITINTVN